MSRPKRQLQKEIAHAVTHGKPQIKKLPATLALARAQSLSLTALNNDSNRLQRQAQEIATAIEQTNAARVEVIAEIAKAHGLTVEEIGSYQFDGSRLLQPKA